MEGGDPAPGTSGPRIDRGGGIPGKDPGASGADGKQRPWECPPPDDCDTPGVGPYNQRMFEQDMAQKIDQWEKNQGDVPGTLKRFADEILRPKVDPFKALHAAVKYAVTAVNGLGDYARRKLAGRQPPGSTHLPAPTKPVPRATLIVATSGSMGSKELAKALGVVKQGLRSVPAGGIKVISGDTSARAVEKVFLAEDITKAGGMVYVCVSSEGKYHAHPVDCWRFQPDCWAGLASWCRRAMLVDSYVDDSDPFWKDNVGIFRVS